MTNKIAYLAAFLAGAAVGAAFSWRFAKDKYERIAEEEIQSVKRTYSHREAVVRKASDGNADNKQSVLQYAAKLQQYGYTAEGVSEPEKEAPYVISPEEFGERDDYDSISLTYYADGVVADDRDEILENIETVVGAESLEHFGEYEDDSVFVRNDRLKCDYEILLDQRNYADVLNETPPRQRKE